VFEVMERPRRKRLSWESSRCEPSDRPSVVEALSAGWLGGASGSALDAETAAASAVRGGGGDPGGLSTLGLRSGAAGRPGCSSALNDRQAKDRAPDTHGVDGDARSDRARAPCAVGGSCSSRPLAR
jgi:hypothetical protein